MYLSTSVYSVSSQRLEIVHPGTINHFSGPDFNTSKIRCKDELLVGRTELHVKTSDFLKHNHQSDAAFNKLLAHVVWEHDMAEDPSGALFTIELKNQCTEEVLASVKKLLLQDQELACADFAKEVPSIYKQNMLQSCLVERLEEKANLLRKDFEQHEIAYVFLQKLAYSLGAPVNSFPMEMLMKQFDLKILFKLGAQQAQLEALLFGMAGRYNFPLDEYVKQRMQQFEFLKYKFKLKPMSPAVWKNGGMRPVSHPERILMLLASLIAKNARALLAWLEFKEIQGLYDYLNIDIPDYWQRHYQLGKKAKKPIGGLGAAMKSRLIVNCFLPFLFAYGRFVGKTSYEEKAIEFYEQLKAEQFGISKQYKNLGFQLESAGASQGLIQLHRQYCLAKKCLNCQVANHRLKKLHEQVKKHS